MKFAYFAYSTLGLIAAGSLAWGCTSKSNDCKFNLDCGPYDGGAAGISGVSGNAGKGGSGGIGGGKGGGGAENDGGSAGDEGGASGVGANAGTSGSGGSGGAPCVGSASPDSAQCVIGDEYGLFVSLSGDDASGDGTEAKPYATVTKALTLTGPGKLNRVYVCSTANGSTTSYAEPDTLVIPDRVSIYGGFTCVAGIWAYDTTVKAWLKPVSPVGAIVSGALNGVTVQDLRIDAMNAPEDGTGASSFGMIVKGSKGVVLTRVEVHAGKGGGGAAGVDGPNGADGSGLAGVGTIAACGAGVTSPSIGGKAAAATCGSKGGDGGSGATGTAYQGPQDGFSGSPSANIDPFPNSNGGKGALMVGTSHPGAGGTVGSSGLSGAPGAFPSHLGLISANGYAPASGGNGLPGFPGQGGGGGGASLGTSTCVGASGGGGGMGGCGGDPGTGGGGGGASIALLSWNSIEMLDACALVASAGGAGGKGGMAHSGGAGVAGGAGGPADTADGIASGGRGGDGGNGGNGGSGAGGTGGPSMALVWSVTKPMLVNSPTLTPAAGGAHGVGGHLGLNTTNWAPDGSDGMSAAEYEQK